MNDNADSNTENVIDKSLEDVPQKTTETSTTPSAATIPKAETSRPKFAGALTPDGRKVPLPDDPNTAYSLFGVVNKATNEVRLQLIGQPDNSISGEVAVDATSPPTITGITAISPTKVSQEAVVEVSSSTTATMETPVQSQDHVPNMDTSEKPPDGQLLPAPYGTSELSLASGVDYNRSNIPRDGPSSIKKINGIPISNPYPDLYAGPMYQPTTGKTTFLNHGFGSLTDDQFWEIVKVLIIKRWLYKYRNVKYMLMDGVYVRYDRLFMIQAILVLILKMYGFEPSSCTVCDDILREALCRADNFYGNPNDERFTLFLNGYVDNQTGQLLATVPDYFPTIKVEANYLDQYYILNHPLTDKFFETLAGGDPVKIALLWQCLGYCISSDAKAKVIFILLGPKGDNGKSTYLSFIQSFLTPSGVKNLSMKNLLGSRFAMSELEFARVNASADEGAISLNMEALGQLKNLSGHDYINGDVKGQEQTRFLSTCKLMIASNSNISVGYTTSDPAFERRLVTIPFEVSIPKEEQDPNLLNKLMAERDMVATRAMKCYLELKANNYQFAGREQFNKQILVAPNSAEYELIRRFSEDYCNFSDSEEFISTQNLYNAFCKVYGDIFKDITAFSQAFYRINESRVRKSKRHTSTSNCWGYRGVSLQEEY